MKFCFFGNVAEALKGRTPGGGELQIALLAKALALKGHDVGCRRSSSNPEFRNRRGCTTDQRTRMEQRTQRTSAVHQSHSGLEKNIR